MIGKTALCAFATLALATLSNASVNLFQLDQAFLDLFGDSNTGSGNVPSVSAAGEAPYSLERLEAFRVNFLTNLNYSGTDAIVAARSKSDPNYFYDWARDGALTMQTLMNVMDFPSKAAKFEWYERYLRWTLLTHSQKGNPGFDVRGEPKSYVDGTIYDGPWGRSQNDGPALRASVLIDYANELLAEGKAEYVLSKMYFPDLSVKRGIKYDLEYVAHNWREATFEPWEEVSGRHFFVTMVQRKALLKGAVLANKLNDPEAAAYYNGQAKEMGDYLEIFYDPCKNNIIPSRDYGGSDTAKNKLDMDVATYLAALYGGLEGETFSVTDDRILASLLHLESYFAQEYSINAKDDQYVPGVLFGRYPRDIYDGNGTSRGNPWFLTTAAASEVYYRNAKAARSLYNAKKSLTISCAGKEFYLDAVKYIPNETIKNDLTTTISRLYDQTCDRKILTSQLQKGSETQVYISGEALAALADALNTKGDNHNARLNRHVNPDDSLSEQIDRDGGYQRGAQHLTWSYANVLSAMAAREKF